MTIEEAIKHITKWLYAAPDVPPMQVVQALELAVSALRAGGKGMNVPTIPAGQPLTLEQLRGMVGKPAFLLKVNCNVLIARNEGVPLFTFSDGSQVSAVDWYEEVGAAYAYPPTHIDREAWTGCMCNTKSKSCCTCVSLRCQFCIGESEYKRGKYCSACGRPLTEEAWAELEKRVRGNEMKAYFEGEKGVLVFKPLPGGKRGRPKKRTNEERLKQMGTQELARELSLIAMWDRKQLKKAQENPGLEAFMGEWLREPAGEVLGTDCSDFEQIMVDAAESITDLLARAEAADILGDNYDLDRLRELVEADRDGRCVVFFAKPGQEVWVVERDEIGKPDCVSGFVFMAGVGGLAIVHPFLGECGDIDEILNNCAEETARNYSCDVSVFPVVDCYESCEAAEAALKAERW